MYSFTSYFTSVAKYFVKVYLTVYESLASMLCPTGVYVYGIQDAQILPHPT